MFSSESIPTHLPAPPRIVHGGGGCALWFIRIFILPHMLAGIFMAGQFLLAALTAALGTDVMATVIKAYTSHGSKGGTIYNIRYSYHVGGRGFTNSTSVGSTTYAALNHPGELEGQSAKVRVRYLQLGPYVHHLLVEEHSAWAAAGGFLLFTLFWNAILSIFVAVVWVIPIRRRLLVKYGEVAAGTVVSTRTRQGKSTSYYVTFRFRDPRTGAEIERETDIPGQAQYALAVRDLPVTVIYSPRNPKRAVIYELCGYRVEGAQSA